MADNRTSKIPALGKRQAVRPPGDRSQGARPVSGDDTGGKAKVEQFGERGLGVAAKE
ncbi:hypothetical protein [Sphingomonas sp.]|uniref:hypothetical protein n=1 Tax=Sphingomonas sp. TaxID=28214 RepID=UPI0025FA6F5B|nr:hypothetical protein [Sphingomonas sp.]MBV9528273.1 hypothetical protein [Sphingomonas sp.]